MAPVRAGARETGNMDGGLGLGVWGSGGLGSQEGDQGTGRGGARVGVGVWGPGARTTIRWLGNEDGEPGVQGSGSEGADRNPGTKWQGRDPGTQGPRV